MKHSIIVILLLLSLQGKAQKNGDTLFSTWQHVVVQEPHSSYHDLVFKYMLGKMDTSPFNTDASFKGQWVRIYDHEGKKYAYCPSNYISNYFMAINDTSILLNGFEDGFHTFKLQNKASGADSFHFNIKAPNAKQYSFVLKKISNDMIKVRSALLGSKEIYFIKRDKYADLPIIVNKCDPYNRCDEFFND